MVGPGVEMFPQPRRDGVGGAVGDDSVDEAVAAGTRQVFVSEAQSLPVVQVIGQVEVNVECLAADGTSLVGVLVVSTTLCSGARNADGPISSRACAVCSGGVR